MTLRRVRLGVSLVLLCGTVMCMSCVPRQDQPFGVRVKTRRGDGVDTFAGTITKDLISLPDTTVSCALTKDEVERIRRMVVKAQFFDLPDTLVDFGDDGWRADQIEVRMGRKTKTVAVRALRPRDLPPGVPLREWTPSDQKRRFDELTLRIIDLLRAKEEYKALPNSQGAYL
jgi:hypothetical protein